MNTCYECTYFSGFQSKNIPEPFGFCRFKFPAPVQIMVENQLNYIQVHREDSCSLFEQGESDAG